MNKAILINRKLTAAETDIISDIRKLDNKLIIYATSHLSLPFDFQIIEQDAEVKREINIRELNTVLKFGDIKFRGKTLAEHLTFNGMSFWHYHKFRIYFILRNLTYEIDLVQKLASEFDEIICYSDGPETNLLSDKINVEFRYPSFKQKGKLLPKFRYIFFLMARFILGLSFPLKKRKEKHVLLDRGNKQPCLNLKSLKPEPENYNLAYMFAKADADFVIIDEIEPPKFIEGNNFNLKKWMFFNPRKNLKRVPGEYIILRAIFSPEIWRIFRIVDKSIMQMLSNLLNEPLTNKEKWVVKRITQFHKSSQLYLFKNLAYQRYFSTQNFKTISTIDENSPAVKSILDAARTRSIKTIGIQHGNIHELHPAYRFTENDIQRNLICDSTIVWGEYWREFLNSVSGYPDHRVYIAGQSRTDIIPLLLKRSLTQSTQSGLPNKKIVVFASQLQQDPLLRERAAFDVFKSVKDLKQVHLVVKLHPSEVRESEYYRQIAEQVKCSDYTITSSMDLYQLLASSIILITCFSTVGAEAVYFNKPLIILDHLEQDIQGYIRQNVAFKATGWQEMKTLIEKIVSNDIKPDEQSRELFIRRNAFAIDGHTSERIIDFIRHNG
jgi:hypothetical protein